MTATADVHYLNQPSFSGKLPKRQKNSDVRSREYLTEEEVESLEKAAREIGRHGGMQHLFYLPTVMAYGYQNW